MNSSTLHDVIAGTAVRVLEDAAFIFSDRAEDSVIPDRESWRPAGVSLHFHGPYTGSVTLWADRAFAIHVAANMTGVDGEGEDAEMQNGIDALKEIVNIITGNFLTTWQGVDAVFDLGIPELLPAEMFSLDDRCEQVWLVAEGYPVMMEVKIQE